MNIELGGGLTRCISVHTDKFSRVKLAPKMITMLVKSQNETFIRCQILSLSESMTLFKELFTFDKRVIFINKKDPH